MLALVLVAISSLFSEIGSSIGKRKIELKEESMYTMAFLSYFWSSFWFLGVMILNNSFIFSLASLPTFLTRAVLEIIQTEIAIQALVRAERATFGFIRTGTVVMLLFVDLALGYSVSVAQMAGMAVISLTLEQCMEYIGDDELVEVTPKSIRIRKRILKNNLRK